MKITKLVYIFLYLLKTFKQKNERFIYYLILLYPTMKEKISITISKETLREAKAKVKKESMKYTSLSHYIDLAIMEKNKQR